MDYLIEPRSCLSKSSNLYRALCSTCLFSFIKLNRLAYITFLLAYSSPLNILGMTALHALQTFEDARVD